MGNKTIAYLIDPYAGTITPQMIDPDSLKDTYRLLDCNLVEAVYIAEVDDVIFVDEEGLMKDLKKTEFFVIDTGVDLKLICGRGLWTGASEEGDTVAPAKFITDVAQFVQRVTDRDRAQALAQHILDRSGAVVFTKEAYLSIVKEREDQRREIEGLAKEPFRIG